MKILQVCNKIPFPPQDGGAIGINNVTQSFVYKGHTVKVIAINTLKHNITTAELPEQYVKDTSIELVFIDTRVKYLPALINIFSRKSYNIQRFNHQNLKKKLIELLKENQFDIIQIESIFLKDYVDIIRKFSNAKIILRAPNIEFRIWEQMAQKSTNAIKKIYLAFLARRLKKEEINAYRFFDGIYTVTKGDKDFILGTGYNGLIDFIPTGLDWNKSSDEHYSIEKNSFFHIGAMDWMPNIEAVKWLLNILWPKLNVLNQDINLYIAGRNTPEWLAKAKIPNVHILGEVSDAGEFIKSKNIMLVPLFSGSGMRVKIIEGMMMGKTIISTTIGAEGIEYEHGKNILIANSLNDFIENIQWCINNDDLCETIGKNAKIHASNLYGNQILSDKLDKFITSFSIP